MLLRQMQYFVSVVECNSFTEAAERCFVSQSAISQQIKALESELGVSLILRKNRGFSVTEAGKYFYGRSLEILNEVEDLKKKTTLIDHTRKKELRIGYPGSYNGQELYQTIAEFSEKYPMISISISSGTHEELYEDLRLDRVDMVLNDQRRAFSEEYENFKLLNCLCYAEISQQNPLIQKKEVSLAELRDLPCIIVSKRKQQKTEQEYYEKTLGYGNGFLFAETLEAARLLAVGNQGFLPIEQVGTMSLPSPGLKRVPLMRDGVQLTRNFCFFWKKLRTNEYIEAFADIMLTLLKGGHELL